MTEKVTYEELKNKMKALDFVKTQDVSDAEFSITINDTLVHYKRREMWPKTFSANGVSATVSEEGELTLSFCNGGKTISSVTTLELNELQKAFTLTQKIRNKTEMN